MATLGLIARRARWPLLLLGGLFWLALLLLLAAYTLYALNIPVALSGAPDVMATPLKMSMAKTTIMAVTYIVLYAWLGWNALRRGRAARVRP
ncbi:MAG: hypothetical protein ACRELD_11380 [Longimicrobiales bacterium]